MALLVHPVDQHPLATTRNHLRTAQSSTVSNQHTAPFLDACTQGFTDIQASVSAWISASAAYSNGTCVISSGSTPIGTLPIQNVIARSRSHVLLLSTTRRGVRRPGCCASRCKERYRRHSQSVSLRLALTANGFTLTDDDDNTEIYDSAGVLPEHHESKWSRPNRAVRFKWLPQRRHRQLPVIL